jgi:hypothetical protein
MQTSTTLRSGLATPGGAEPVTETWDQIRARHGELPDLYAKADNGKGNKCRQGDACKGEDDGDGAGTEHKPQGLRAAIRRLFGKK